MLPNMLAYLPKFKIKLFLKSCFKFLILLTQLQQYSGNTDKIDVSPILKILSNNSFFSKFFDRRYTHPPNLLFVLLSRTQKRVTHTVVLFHSYTRKLIILFPYLFPYSLFVPFHCWMLPFKKCSLKIADPKFKKSSLGLWLIYKFTSR